MPSDVKDIQREVEDGREPRPALRDTRTEVVENRDRQAVRVLLRLEHQRGNRGNQNHLANALLPVPRVVTHSLASTGGIADYRYINTVVQNQIQCALIR
jgi:hypothetical protein